MRSGKSEFRSSACLSRGSARVIREMWAHDAVCGLVEGEWSWDSVKEPTDICG